MRSGQSMAGFARQHGLMYHRLRQWVQEGGHRLPSPGPKAAKFEPVAMGSLFGAGWAAEVVAANGVTVRLSAQVPPSLALELVALSGRL
jgi:hypothetical protein